MANDVIAAIATPPGRGGVGIVRVSGPALRSFYRALTHAARDPVPRRAHVATFFAADGGAIDSGLALYFPAPHSFTGEDIVELHGHGGVVVMQLLLQRALELGARAAQPGEFTQRAFLNGRLDLAQAEGVADLIDAATSAAARAAMRSLSGEFSRAIDALAGELTQLRALTEATLDFPDEEVEFLEAARAVQRLKVVQSRLDEALARAQQGALLRDGIHVVISGAPNVGKSSIINALAGNDLAIVTPIPGTTRDVIRQEIQIDGVPMHIIDTAGLRLTDDEIERIGIERALREVERADIVLEVIDATAAVCVDAVRPKIAPRAMVVLVRNKIDLTGDAATLERTEAGWTVAISAKTGAGFELLKQAILRAAGWQKMEEGVFLARERHLRALRLAASHVVRALELTESLELFAEELRQAQEALGQITGRVTADDLLGEIFSRFCIGK